MELRHLRYFVAVAELLNYRRAAERLRVAQPALSRQIKDLEEAVGARLLERNTGGVSLTDAGAVFLDEAREILERVEMAVAAAQEAEAGRGGRLVIGNLGALSATFLPTALAMFRSRYPEVDVNLHELSLPEQLSALRTGLLHLAFTIDNDATMPPDVECAEILEARVGVVLGKEHPLARQSRVSLMDLADEQFLCIGESVSHTLHRKRVEQAFEMRGIKHRPIKRVNSVESLVALVAGNHGVSLLLPVHTTPGSEIVFRRIKEDGPDLDVRLCVAWRKNRESKLVRNFVQALRDCRPRLA